jgi:hypothetical protein
VKKGEMMQRIPGAYAAYLALVALLVVACGAPRATTTSAPPPSATAPSVTATPAPVLTDIHGPDDLKVRFNQDVGVPRIILLVSPT